MKRIVFILALILCVTLCACTFVSCADNSGSGSGGTEQGGGETPSTTKYKVTFKQEGQADVVIEVKEGESVLSSEIPELLPKAGFTVKWENVDLTNIKKDITVNAVYTVATKEYTITLNYSGAKENDFIKVKEGEVPNLPKTIYDEKFGTLEITWKLENGKVYSGVYTHAEDITLFAEYSLWT